MKSSGTAGGDNSNNPLIFSSSEATENSNNSLLSFKTKRRLSGGKSKETIYAPAEMHPEGFAPPFDVVSVLDKNKDKYTGEKPLSLSSFPAVCRINIERLKPHLRSSASMYNLVSACMFYGISSISKHNGVKDLLQLKHRFRCAPKKLNGVVQKTLSQFFSDFSIDVPNGKRLNVNVPDNQHSTVARIAGELGATINSLCVLSIMTTLIEQRYTNEDDKRDMGRSLELFFQSVDIRVRGVRALMNEFTIPEVETSPIFHEEEFYEG
jgi:hypothetical protein